MSRSQYAGSADTAGSAVRPGPVLVVDDESDNLDAFRFNFHKDFDLRLLQTPQTALDVLKKEPIAVIVADQRMPQLCGLEFLKQARALAPLAVPILLTAYADIDVFVQAINEGQLYRYVSKPWEKQVLRATLFQALERHRLLSENARLHEHLQQYAGYLQHELHAAADFGKLVGDSPAWRASLGRVQQVARTQATVLLRGESGTGKELLAHAIHVNSPRKDKPFVRVNCAALPQGVLESELFGHERGSFTGAGCRRLGRFELATGGTIFLDEVGDLPPEVQVKLLRVLQEQTFERVGSSETVTTDVRIVSATHRNLETMIADGSFRQDLYYRLNVFPIFLPPLRDRLSDLPALAQHFLLKWRRHAVQPVYALSPEAVALLQTYSFPGNVRELENLIERALILASGPTITPAELELLRPSDVPTTAPKRPVVQEADPTLASEPIEVAEPWRTDTAAAKGTTTPDSAPLAEKLLQQERGEIVRAFERAEGNVARAARLLGCNRSTLYYRLRRLGLLQLLPAKTDSPDRAPL